MTKKICPVILSGGSGSRLWPVSRSAYPKQFLELGSSGSLFQNTLRRVSKHDIFHTAIIIANNEHRFVVSEQAKEIGIELHKIVLEPCGRNTAPAAVVASLIVQQMDPETLVLLLPSDHVISAEERFLDACARAERVAEAGYLVTFGIEPDRPETGYGYIRRGDPLTAAEGAFAVSAFIEKPEESLAKQYLETGEFTWNSGMFLFAAERLLDEMQKFAPEVLTFARKSLEAAQQDLGFLRLDEDAFAAAPSLSLDYAMMEKTDRAAVIPVEMGWSDVGAWQALWLLSQKDERGNVQIGDVIAQESKGCYLRCEKGPLIAVTGLEDVVVVSTPDAVLVASKREAAAVKALVETLDASGRHEAKYHKQVFRPWGHYTDTDEAPGFRTKRIVVKPGQRLSLQRHKHRSEHWVVVRGTAKITIGEDEMLLSANQSTYIPKGVLHRLENPEEELLYLVEVQVGDYLGEDDIERFEDIYGRQ